MKVNVNEDILQLDKKFFNINNLDFVLLNGKVRIYLSSGEVETLAAGYTVEEIKEAYAKIASKLPDFCENFVSVKGAVLNLENIKSLQHGKQGTQIATHGFTLQLMNLSEEEVLLIKSKMKDIAETKQTAV